MLTLTSQSLPRTKFAVARCYRRSQPALEPVVRRAEEASVGVDGARRTIGVTSRAVRQRVPSPGNKKRPA